jgi:hypothetical protein
MTDKLQESILIATYGSATRELTDLVMAAEAAYSNLGKRSLFGKDKGKVCIVCGAGFASRRRLQVSSNVRRRRATASALNRR